MKRLINSVLLILIMFSISSAQKTDLSGLKFCIDPGHGGNNAANDRHVVPDPGIDFWESESNFQKALLLKQMIEEKGGWVVLTRNTNYYPDDNEPSLSTRAAIANANTVHWFNSIHSNATGGTNSGTNYTLMLIKEDIPTRQPAFPEALTMADKLGKHIKANNRTSTYYVRLDYTFYGGPGVGFNLGVLRPLLMPGTLSEGSFHDFYPETRRLMNNQYRKMEAYGLLRGYLEYFGVPFDSMGFIAGVQTDSETGKPKNLSKVRLLPANTLYSGDSFNNGYYLFDRLSPGLHKVVFETPDYGKDTVNQTVAVSGLHFLDRTLYIAIPPTITSSQPLPGDTAFKVNNLIGVRFSRPMDTVSVRLAFSMSPFTSGNFTWTAGSTMLLFTPNPVLLYNTNYTLTIAATAKSLGGVPIDGNNDGIPGDPFILNFKTESHTTNISETGNVPHKFELKQNFPNPFNPSTTIKFQIPKTSYVTLKVYDILGREVATLVNEVKEACNYLVTFDVSALAKLTSGVYYYRLTLGIFSEMKKMSLLK
ncbi:MAG: N-acetylmuramoyl-L-alanine amidase [Bacteroidetes bacterium]|nr:N-acetylmuramoyl-L-alanine amidase [Bacteroidota bacterium]MBU2584235.1 N-acetylmuramoyl-L-alanine amidase [Bacteroidota bacterium]